MNKISKEEWLATKVMKWTVMKPSGVLVFDTGQRSGMKLKDWQPDKDITQAMMLLEQFKHWALYSYWEDVGYQCQIDANDHQSVIGEGISVFMATAICEATLQASGYYKENSNDN